MNIKPAPKQVSLLNHILVSMTYLMRSNHRSIPIPVTNAVIKPKKTGFFLTNIELQIKMMIEIKTSQLPTVRPNSLERPTKRASNGEAPSPDCIVNEIPKLNTSTPKP